MLAVLHAGGRVVSTAHLGGALALLLAATGAGTVVYLGLCRAMGVRELRLLRLRRTAPA